MSSEDRGRTQHEIIGEAVENMVDAEINFTGDAAMKNCLKDQWLHQHHRRCRREDPVPEAREVPGEVTGGYCF